MGWQTEFERIIVAIPPDEIPDLAAELLRFVLREFNRPADPKDAGFGNTPEQIAAFKSPDIQTILDYNEAVFERAKRHFLSMSNSDWDRPLDERWQGTPIKIGWRLRSVLEDCLQHTGQMAYIRGLRQGKGWQKY